jgi:hypothetical protein
MQELDFVIRALAVMDGEQERLLTFGLSEIIPPEIRDLAHRAQDAIRNDAPEMNELCAKLLQSLLPFVSDPELFKNDFEAWEDKLFS